MISDSTEMLGSLQAKIMNILWRSKKPLKPAEVLAKLSDDHAYTTVITILSRLTDKKLLKRQLVGKAYFYSPVSDKKQFISANLKDIYGDLVDSYGQIAISQFVDVIKDNKKDLAALKQYLDSHQWN